MKRDLSDDEQECIVKSCILELERRKCPRCSRPVAHSYHAAVLVRRSDQSWFVTVGWLCRGCITSKSSDVDLDETALIRDGILPSPVPVPDAFKGFLK